METVIYTYENAELGMMVDVAEVNNKHGVYRVRLIDTDAARPVSVTFCPNLAVAMDHVKKIKN